MPTKTIPAKLREDAIIEAILEIRFDTQIIPEILFGRLADSQAWRGFAQARLPAYEIPDPIRQVDATLRFAPVFELQDTKNHRAVRIGPHVLSYHQRAPYVGWAAFKPELLKAVEALCSTAQRPTVRRLGLRYINALTTPAHRISSLSDLDLKIAVADETLSGRVNVSFSKDVFAETQVVVRVTTPDFVQGRLPPQTVVVADVDVATKNSYRTDSESAIKDWIEQAHTHEKNQFFSLLTTETIEALKES